jgi:hypothetical protein
MEMNNMSLQEVIGNMSSMKLEEYAQQFDENLSQCDEDCSQCEQFVERYTNFEDLDNLQEFPESEEMEVDEMEVDFPETEKFETDSDIEEEEFEDFLEGIRMITPVDFEKFCIYKDAFKRNRGFKVKFSTLIKMIREQQDIKDLLVNEDEETEPEYETTYLIEYLLSGK